MVVNVEVYDGGTFEDRLVASSVISSFIYGFVAEFGLGDGNSNLNIASLASKLDRFVKIATFSSSY